MKFSTWRKRYNGAGASVSFYATKQAALFGLGCRLIDMRAALAEDNGEVDVTRKMYRAYERLYRAVEALEGVQ